MMINDESFDSLVFLCVQFMAKLDVRQLELLGCCRRRFGLESTQVNHLTVSFEWALILSDVIYEKDIVFPDVPGVGNIYPAIVVIFSLM